MDEDSYKDAYQLVQDLIKYQKEKGRKFISFPKTFWENYFNYYQLNPGIDNKIQKLDELYELLKSYSELEQDDSEYKEKLAENIHKIIEDKIKKENIGIQKQLELLFEKDIYYMYEDYKNKRDPEIFKEIKIYDLNKKEDVNYFKEKDLEKIYGDSFAFVEEKEKEEEKNEEVKKEVIIKKYFLNTIIERIETIEHFTFIINLIKINKKENEKNKNANVFIELLIKKYLDFKDEDLDEKSFFIFLEKVIEYSPNKKVELLQSLLPKFRQNYNIYLKLFEKYKEDDDIQKQLAISSFTNLELTNFVELIKQLENEENKIQLFNNLGKEKIVRYENFLNKEKTNNIQILTELMKNKLIPENISYLEDSKDKLTTIFEKLSSFNEKKKVYLDTILNEDKEIQKIFAERFKLFKLIKNEETFDPNLEFTKIIEKYNKVKDYIEKAYNISKQLSFYFKETLKEEMDKINETYNDYSNPDKEVKEWIFKEKDLEEFINLYEDKSNLIATIKEIKLFLLIYKEFNKGYETEKEKFDNAIKLLNECSIIFKDRYKGNQDILDKYQKLLKKEKDNKVIEQELKNLKDYYKIDEKEGSEDIAKNILIFS